MRDRVTAARKVQSAVILAHGKPDPWPQLANPTAQLANSALSAHTAIRATLNHPTLNDRQTLRPTLNNRRTRDPETENLDPPQHQPSLQPDLVEVQQEIALLRGAKGLLIGGAA